MSPSAAMLVITV